MLKFRFLVVLAVALVSLGLGNATYADSMTLSNPATISASAVAAANASFMEKTSLASTSTPEMHIQGNTFLVLPVPEPGTSTLLVCGLIGLAGISRKFLPV